MSAAEHSHAELMDGVYRYQRHVYDLTRKYYLLGRDRLIDDLAVPPGGAVLELGCGTGRNLVKVARALSARHSFFGLDISAEMLETAAVADRPTRPVRPRQARARRRIRLRRGNAVRPAGLRPRLRLLCAVDDPGVASARSRLRSTRSTPGGSLHIVDFGRQERLPGWFRTGAARLAGEIPRHRPRDSMREVLESECRRVGASL